MILWWQALGANARTVLAAGVACIVLGLAAASWWALRSDHAVLFSDLRPQDAALISGELDKLKVPFAISEDGSALLVDRSQVHAVRLKLMGRDLPLNGTVGLEIFNHTDFGMTEFAQKVNYQRALQGELTRTILSFPEVRDARVHLALPEQSLFRQNASRAKAAITVAMRPGQVLRPEQTAGIQRLVAAAVPALTASEVTIVDQQGVALSRPAEADAGTTQTDARLDLKREMEAYLSRKAGLVLEKTFGAGNTLVSVDVALNLDQVRVTLEDVIAAPDQRGGPAAGVLVRERESARDGGAPDARVADGRAVRGSSMQRDAEYQAGRRVEQVVSQPGAIRRISVVAVVRQTLPQIHGRQLQELVAAAVGASADRGDTIVVQTLQPAAPEQPALAQAPGQPRTTEAPWPVLPLSGVGAVVVLLACFWLLRRRSSPRAPVVLTDSERHATLSRVQGWLIESDALQDRSMAARGDGATS